MLIVKNLEKFYKSHRVLNISDLEIKRGEKVGIMGRNGSGKSTLAEIIIGTKKSSKGEIIWTEKVHQKNAIFQESSFELQMSTYQIAKHFRNLFKKNTNLDELFNLFELSSVKHQNYYKLSGGEKQKFKFLIALINNPEFLLLDELTTALDYVWREKIIKLIDNYFQTQIQPVTAIFISHDKWEIAKLCTRVILLEQGQIKNNISLTNNIEQNLKILEGILNNAGSN